MKATQLIRARTKLIYVLAEEAKAAVLDPDAPVGRPPAESIVKGFRDLLTAYEQVTKSTSTSNQGYEFRDLAGEEKRAHEEAKHLIGILESLYGPRAS